MQSVIPQFGFEYIRGLLSLFIYIYTVYMYIYIYIYI